MLNLGVEGMMLIGALTGFVAVAHGNGLIIATLLACVAGMLAALAFAF